jgi:hypothetical protein
VVDHSTNDAALRRWRCAVVLPWRSDRGLELGELAPAGRVRAVEGLMLKHRDAIIASAEPGSRRGRRWKWKIDPTPSTR